ncbi:MAG: outer membrane protein transport protein, partial [Planctomycetes bacterium]|nr:outer membrane protein transport protein [Planctomycetota bacterium]
MIRRRVYSHLTLAALAAWALVPAARAANGLFPIEFGARGHGRGGASTGVIGDTSALNRNPASIAFIVGRQLDQTVEVFVQKLHYEQTQFEPGVDSEDELVIAPFFGYVFDHPLDLLTLPVDIYDAYFASAAPPVLGSRREIYVRSEGRGYIEVPLAAVPGRLILEAEGRGAAIADVQVLAYTRSEEVGKGYRSVVQIQDFPGIPPDAVVSGVVAQFEWRYVQRVNDEFVKLKLAVDDREQNTRFRSLSPDWQKAEVSELFDQRELPMRIAVLLDTAGNTVELRNFRTILVYRQGDKYFQETLAHREDPFPVGSGLESRVLAEEAGVRDVAESFAPVARFDSLPPLPPGTELERVRIAYRYVFPAGRDAVGLIRIRLVGEHEVLAHQTHSPTEGGPVPTEHVPPELRQDYQVRTIPEGSGWKFGFGVFPQGGSQLNTKVRSELFPEGNDQRVNLLILSLVPAAAYRFNEHFSLGIAPNFDIAQLEIDGLVGQSADILKGEPLSGISYADFLGATAGVNEIRGEIDSEFLRGWGFGGRIGALYRHDDSFSVGASYASRTFLTDLSGEAHIDFTRFFNATGLGLPALLFLPNGGLNGLETDVDMTIEDFELPQHVTVGFAYKPVPWFQLSADGRWINWSDTFDTLTV